MFNSDRSARRSNEQLVPLGRNRVNLVPPCRKEAESKHKGTPRLCQVVLLPPLPLPGIVCYRHASSRDKSHLGQMLIEAPNFQNRQPALLSHPYSPLLAALAVADARNIRRK